MKHSFDNTNYKNCDFIIGYVVEVERLLSLAKCILMHYRKDITQIVF